MKRITATILATTALASAPAAGAQTYYVAGTKQPGADSTVPVGEELVLAGPSVVIQYPRSLPPVVPGPSFDASVAVAASQLVAAVGPGDRVVGVSQGAHASELARQATDTGALYETYGDPTNSDGGLETKLGQLPRVLGITPLRTDDNDADPKVTYVREYDLIADAPDNANPVAWANAVLGAAYLHGSYLPENFDGVGEELVVTQRGPASTHVLSKMANLPLVQPLRDLGVDERAVRSLEAPLRRAVDSGYTGRRTSAPGSSGGSVGVSADD